MSTALMVTTCGRRYYLERSLESLHANTDPGEFSHRFLIDDSGDAGYGRWLRDTFAGWTVLSHGVRAGLGAAIETGWDAIRRTDAFYVFHTEDDFTFEGPVPLAAMRTALDSDRLLAQVTLYRQPWSPQERALGGYLRDGRWSSRPHAGYELWTDGQLFSFNPTLYRRRIADACVGGLEADVTAQLDGYRFGVLAGPGERPLCWHIGAERSVGWRR